jgi:hypothetical protein
MIHLIVEGDGDAAVIPILLRRALGRDIPGMKCSSLKSRSVIVRKAKQGDGFEGAVRRLHLRPQKAYLVLLDHYAGVPCPPYRTMEEEQADMRQRAEKLEREIKAKVRVYWVKQETESWLLGGLMQACCGIRKVGAVSGNTDLNPLDPKKVLGEWFGRRTKPVDLECLAKRIELTAARARNRSMDDFCKDSDKLLRDLNL